MQVLDFTEKTHKHGVEVDTDEALFSKFGLFFDEKELVEVNLGVVFNTLNPLGDLCLFKVFEALAKGQVKFLHILELFTLLDRGRELLETFHGFVDSIEETAGPVKSTGNWGHVRADGGSLINTLNQNSTFLEDLLGDLEVGLEELEEGDLLAFKLILDDGSVEESLERIEHLEFSDNGVTVVKRLGED